MKRKNGKKLLVKNFSAIVIAALMLCISVPAGPHVYAAARQHESSYKNVSFKFTSDTGRPRTIKSSCYYSDSLFAKPADKFNQRLLQASLGMTMSAFQARGAMLPGGGGRNVKSFMKSIGMSDIDTELYEGKTGPNTIGAAIGSKNITVNGDKYLLVAVAVRGAGYGREWVSNMKVGSSGSHQGMTEAASKVSSEAVKYIKEHKGKRKIKIWITGYSRGAGTADIASVKIQRSLSGLKPEVYTYAFAAPMTVTKTSRQNAGSYNDGIYNIINGDDWVPKVPFSEWNFTRYGTDWYYGSASSAVPADRQVSGRDDAVYRRFRKNLRQIHPNLKYPCFDFYTYSLKRSGFGKYKTVRQDKINQGDYFNNFADDWFLRFGGSRAYSGELTRTAYADGPQKSFMYLMNLRGSQDAKKREKFQKELNREFDAGTITRFAIKASIFRTDKSTAKEISRHIGDAADRSGVKYSRKELNRACRNMSPMLQSLISSDLTRNRGTHLLTLSKNMTSIEKAHYPSAALAWIRAYDPAVYDKERKPIEIRVDKSNSAAEVTGESVYLKGDEVSVSVTGIPDGYRFKGWYSSKDKKVSGRKNYKFKAYKNRYLQAKFKKTDEEEEE